MVASDIHGSKYYCERMLEAYKKEGAERLILLGDILYHGPRNELPREYAPKAVIELLNAVREELLCVRGNCDAEVDQMVLNFPILATYAILPFGKNIIFVTHGHEFNEESVPPLKRGDVLLNGHFHVPRAVMHEDYLYINPGSVSLPKENSPHSFLVIEDNKFIFKDIESGEVFLEYTV